ncbi:pyridoxal phosphate-dependent aminotransferase [Pseudoalteromonas shioyasakiensis]|uniref:pyridoxal phosphate-dependent aminotransferase n=1 Tax=Pseudoalteromonas TaxID=53246 RepID=UPI000C8B430E|nr:MULTISPECIES: pyridoxal phosphate-dependent aminotransferase [Pseudoalteromonas]MAD02846.1 aminotransferase [Pseudoalteromonas sp.]MCG9710363.1 pyridoxal phosphate-dependent aminotransferase [Pseudoalteromonas sp. Isolate3]MCP4586286.1 pyridoxal phosphate-dependent aminotransferase [Pseudoalteromonas sp.]MCQ8881741.1 pyridoxal phosphate-dependent aminotransferase [Pseudoalteromonas shioyasakiensis]NIZ06512.1 pyridoxal phosphate-dependent aminotransferase [Pseudoalteromonas sp. HF66]|tara:strand:- start:2040 stop:3257 length:1218 start_codon:yes stop_codon:yes gene_type:complete
MSQIKKSHKLDGVCYDIRGPVLAQARKMEDEGQKVLKLNIGNPAAFGFDMPEDMHKDIIRNLYSAQGYCDSKGLYSARVAVYQHYQQRGLFNLDVDNIYIGNGVSELIQMTTQALLDNDDEVLIPAPDYPLWTASVKLAGGNPVHYLCDEEQDWFPDIADIKSKITSKTKALVLINPNNPTGAVYSDDLLMELINIAREHKLLLLSDEIYEKILYDGVTHSSIGALCDDVPIITFNGLAKTYRAAGLRMGWMVLSGRTSMMDDLSRGLDMLASMRLCANVPAQYAIQQALGGVQSIDNLINPGGRLYVQRDIAWRGLNAIDGISCKKPKGALYAFAKVDTAHFNIKNDERMILDLLKAEKILLVHGRAFNWPDPDHFRLVFLPNKDDLTEAMSKMQRFFADYRQS